METFKQFITEKVLSIGLNPSHDSHREKHRQEIHDILHHSYKSIGGYAGHTSGSKEESHAIHHDITHGVIKATKRNGKISSVSLYKKQHGRKLVAAGTDGSEQGKRDYKKTNLEDHEQKRAWGEVSGAIEHISKKHGHPEIPSSRAKKLLPGKKITREKGDNHYTRDIGGTPHRKIMMGHPKDE